MRRSAVLLLVMITPALLVGQGRRKTAPVKRSTPTPAATPAATPQAGPEPTPQVGKKNSRGTEAKSDETAPAKGYTPVYVYTFDRPGFDYSKIRIEHDEDGRGRIWFKPDTEDTPFDDPLQLSPGTLAILKNAFDELHFLDSTEEYQFAGHDFSNLGNLSITVTRGGKTRAVKYNWTDNKVAKLLMDTYRGIAQEATWKFEMGIARENQPLSTPGLADVMDDYIKRSEIPDPTHLIPYLRELSIDERLPLIARNHFTRIADSIAKTKK
jgi:hypothetical protein